MALAMATHPPDEASPRLPRRLRAVEEPLPPRPMTRGECEAGPRPCPWVSCRYHLAVDVTATQARFIRPELPVENMADTCALDVAVQRPEGLRQEDVAAILDLSIESIRQTEIASRAGMRLAGGPALRALHAEGGGRNPADDVEEIGDTAPMFWREDGKSESETSADLAEVWSSRVIALVAGRIPLAMAARAATSGTWSDGDENEEQPGEQVSPSEEDDMPKTEQEVRKAIVELLGTAPRTIKELAEATGEESGRVSGILSALKAGGQAHGIAGGKASKWHPGPRPEKPAKKAAKPKAPAKPRPLPPVEVPTFVPAPAPERPAFDQVFALLSSAERVALAASLL
jgi:hypothetical protein